MKKPKTAYEATDYYFAQDTGKYHPKEDLIEVRKGSYMSKTNPMFCVGVPDIVYKIDYPNFGSNTI